MNADIAIRSLQIKHGQVSQAAQAAGKQLTTRAHRLLNKVHNKVDTTNWGGAMEMDTLLSATHDAETRWGVTTPLQFRVDGRVFNLSIAVDDGGITSLAVSDQNADSVTQINPLLSIILSVVGYAPDTSGFLVGRQNEIHLRLSGSSASALEWSIDGTSTYVAPPNIAGHRLLTLTPNGSANFTIVVAVTSANGVVTTTEATLKCSSVPLRILETFPDTLPFHTARTPVRVAFNTAVVGIGPGIDATVIGSDGVSAANVQAAYVSSGEVVVGFDTGAASAYTITVRHIQSVSDKNLSTAASHTYTIPVSATTPDGTPAPVVTDWVGPYGDGFALGMANTFLVTATGYVISGHSIRNQANTVVKTDTYTDEVETDTKRITFTPSSSGDHSIVVYARAQGPVVALRDVVLPQSTAAFGIYTSMHTPQPQSYKPNHEWVIPFTGHFTLLPADENKNDRITISDDHNDPSILSDVVSATQVSPNQLRIVLDVYVGPYTVRIPHARMRIHSLANAAAQGTSYHGATLPRPPDAPHPTIVCDDLSVPMADGEYAPGLLNRFVVPDGFELVAVERSDRSPVQVQADSFTIDGTADVLNFFLKRQDRDGVHWIDVRPTPFRIDSVSQPTVRALRTVSLDVAFSWKITPADDLRISTDADVPIPMVLEYTSPRENVVVFETAPVRAGRNGYTARIGSLVVPFSVRGFGLVFSNPYDPDTTDHFAPGLLNTLRIFDLPGTGRVAGLSLTPHNPATEVTWAWDAIDTENVVSFTAADQIDPLFLTLVYDDGATTTARLDVNVFTLVAVSPLSFAFQASGSIDTTFNRRVTSHPRNGIFVLSNAWRVIRSADMRYVADNVVQFTHTHGVRVPYAYEIWSMLSAGTPMQPTNANFTVNVI
jgi:hypothetical protein